MEKKRRLLAVIMAVFMVITMLPSMVFATPSGEMGGKLKIYGYPVVGTTLKADFGKATPAGITSDDVSYKWSRKISEEELTELGTGKEYKVTEEDLGYKLVLEVTGKEDLGLTGSLKAVTTEVTATAEEAKALVDAAIAEKGESSITPPAEEVPVEDVQVEEIPEETQEETPEEEDEWEEIPEEEIQTEEVPQENAQSSAEETEGELLEEEPADDESTEGAELDVTISEELNGDGTAEETPAPEAPAPVYGLTADMDAMVFQDLTAGYQEVADSWTVTLTNSGEDTLTVKVPQSEVFEIVQVIPEGTEGSLVLEKGAQISFNIKPKTGLAEGAYKEDLVFGIEESADITKAVNAGVTVLAPSEITAVTLNPEAVSFDSMKEGYEGVEPVTVTVTNTGNVNVVLAQPIGEYFELGALSVQELAPGAAATFTAVPVAGLAAGEYQEKIQIFQKDNGETPLAELPAVIKVAEKEVSRLTIDTDILDFGEVEAGYEEAPVKQKVTLTNEGNTQVTVEKPVAEYFKTGNPSKDVLEPGESCTIAIRPMDGMDAGTYAETIYIPNSTGEDVSVDVEFTVAEAAAIELLGIQQPTAIKDLKNGVEKSAKGLQLPSKVVIKTSEGNMKVNVKWDVESCKYNPAKKEAQKFEVVGKITLPEGVTDPHEIGNLISVKVSVKAAYVPYMADPANNKIKGIAADGYTTQSKISFEAMGAGMENTSPREGDIRYEPSKWKVINTNSWQGAPYSATFGITKAGNYTLKVLFERQKFDGKKWVPEGEKDTKQVNFSIAQGKVVTPTPAAQQKDDGKKNAVATGDTTAIMPFVIILIVAVICIAGVVIFKKKKK